MATEQYIQYPSTAAQSVPTVPNQASLPVTGAYDGQLYLTTDTDSLYAWNLATVSWVLLNSSSTVTGSGTAGKVTVWNGASSLGVSSASGISYLVSGALNTVSDGTADQMLCMNHTASGYEYKTLTGTANQVTVVGSAGALTLSLPQNINVGASPTFVGLTLSGLNSAGVVHTNGSGVLSTSLLVNADVSGGAAIAYSKLALTNSILNADINASAAIAYSKLSLTNSIVDADINASAAIAFSKLAALTSAHVLVGNGSNIATDVAISGDISLTNAGVTAYSGTVPIAKGGTNITTYTTGDILYASATNVLSKLAKGTSGQNLQIGATIPSWTFDGFVSKTHANTGYTFLSSDGTVYWTLTNASDDTATIPSASSVPGKIFRIRLAATTASFNTLTLNVTGGDTFVSADGLTGLTSLVLQTAGETYEIQSDGTSVWQVLTHRTVTSEVSYTPVFSAGFGTVSSTNATWYRNGNHIFINVYSVTGTVAASSCSISMPGGGALIVDTARVPNGSSNSQLGTFVRINTGGAANIYSASNPGVCFYDGSDTSHLFLAIQSGSNVFSKNNGTTIFNSNDAVSLQCVIPISSWRAQENLCH